MFHYLIPSINSATHLPVPTHSATKPFRLPGTSAAAICVQVTILHPAASSVDLNLLKMIDEVEVNEREMNPRRNAESYQAILF